MVETPDIPAAYPTLLPDADDVAVQVSIRHSGKAAERFEFVLDASSPLLRSGFVDWLSRARVSGAERDAITELANRVFADEAKAALWLRTPSDLFDNRTPLETLLLKDGATLVEDLLWRIDEGMPE